MQRLDLLPEDLEDLVHTFEASFGISLTERELCKAKSIGGLADYVSRKINSPRTSRCLSSVVFYRLRQTFITSFKIPAATIKTKTPLHILMPWVTRRKGWREVQHALQVELPQLLYPVWVIVSSIIITGLVFWAEWFRLVAFSGKALGLAIFFGVFFLWIVVLRVLEPLARKFPRSCETFGDLAKLT